MRRPRKAKSADEEQNGMKLATTHDYSEYADDGKEEYEAVDKTYHYYN